VQVDKKEGLLIEQFFNLKTSENEHHFKKLGSILVDFSYFIE